MGRAAWAALGGSACSVISSEALASVRAEGQPDALGPCPLSRGLALPAGRNRERSNSDMGYGLTHLASRRILSYSMATGELLTSTWGCWAPPTKSVTLFVSPQLIICREARCPGSWVSYRVSSAIRDGQQTWYSR